MNFHEGESDANRDLNLKWLVSYMTFIQHHEYLWKGVQNRTIRPIDQWAAENKSSINSDIASVSSLTGRNYSLETYERSSRFVLLNGAANGGPSAGHQVEGSW